MKDLWKEACSTVGIQRATTYRFAAEHFCKKAEAAMLHQFAEHCAGEDASTLLANAAYSLAMDPNHPPFIRDRFSDVENADKTPGSTPTELFAKAYPKRVFEMGFALMREREAQEQKPARSHHRVLTGSKGLFGGLGG